MKKLKLLIFAVAYAAISLISGRYGQPAEASITSQSAATALLGDRMVMAETR